MTLIGLTLIGIEEEVAEILLWEEVMKMPENKVI
jgi:hypothetical protein